MLNGLDIKTIKSKYALLPDSTDLQSVPIKIDFYLSIIIWDNVNGYTLRARIANPLYLTHILSILLLKKR
jgi:hypothetical protein